MRKYYLNLNGGEGTNVPPTILQVGDSPGRQVLLEFEAPNYEAARHRFSFVQSVGGDYFVLIRDGEPNYSAIDSYERSFHCRSKKV